MTDRIHPLPLGCPTQLACGMRGYHGPECCPPRYRWACDRLVEEFGAQAVRLTHVYDYGWTQRIAVVDPGERHGVSVALQHAGFDEETPEFCLDDHPEALDAMIEEGRRRLRGFGA